MEIVTEPKTVPFSSRFLTVDYLLRWLTLGIYNYLIPYEQTTTTHKFMFVGVQVALAFCTLFFVLLHEYDYYKFENNITNDESFGEKIGNMLQNITKERHYYIHQTFLSVLFRAFFVITFAYMMLVVFNQDRNMLISENVYSMVFSGVSALFLYSLFVLYTSSFCIDYHLAAKQKEAKTTKTSHKKVVKETKKEVQIENDISENDTYQKDVAEPVILTEPKKQVHKTTHKMMTAQTTHQANSQNSIQGNEISHEVDDNDIELIDMEGKVHNYSNRVQEYALESVIFSGLSVAGFVIALSSGKIDFVLLHKFGMSLSDLNKDIVTMNFGGFAKYEIFNLTHENLLFLMLALCLNAAMSFLMVVVSRIKFNDLLEQIDNAIRKARNYNTKEEEMFLLQLQHESGSMQGEQAEIISNRLTELSDKIATQIAKAHTYIHEVEGMLAYITFFRKFGVLLFFLTILAGLMLFDFTIAIFFAIMGILMYAYRIYDDWHRRQRLAKWANK
jgi:hypothetical protein